MTEPTQSSYTRVRKQAPHDETYQMGDERGGSVATNFMKSGNVTNLFQTNQNRMNDELSYNEDERFLEEFDQDEIDQNQTANGRLNQDETFDKQRNAHQIPDEDEHQIDLDHEQDKSNQNFTIIDNNDINHHQELNIGTDFDIEQLEISFDDETYHINSKQSPPIRKKQTLMPDRPISNLEDQLLFDDIDEGEKNDEFNSKTPLREVLKISQHNKFQQNSRARDILPGFKNNTNKQMKFEQKKRNNDALENVFDNNNFLEQEEIDKILMENNISPLKNIQNVENLEDQNRNLNPYEADFNFQNLGSDFNLDYIDEDDELFKPNNNQQFTQKNTFIDQDNVDLLGQGSNFEHLDMLEQQNSYRKKVEDQLLDEEEAQQDIEKRRQVTLENDLNDNLQKNRDRQNIKQIEKTSRKQTSSAMDNYDQLQKSDKKIVQTHHSSKKSQASNFTSQKVAKLSFHDYYQTNPATKGKVIKQNKNSSTSIIQQTSVSSSHDNKKSQSIIVQENKLPPQGSMKLDIIKKKLSSMKANRDPTNKNGGGFSKIPISTKENQIKDKKFKFSRLELPDLNNDSNSGEDKFVPTEKEVLKEDNQVRHNIIPRFNQIQSKIDLDRRPSPLTKLRMMSKISQQNQNKQINNTIDIQPNDKISQNITPSKINKTPQRSIKNQNFNLKASNEKQQINDRIALKSNIVSELRANSYKTQSLKVNQSQQQIQISTDPYERYKQKLLIEQKLKQAPTISQDNSDNFGEQQIIQLNSKLNLHLNSQYETQRPKSGYQQSIMNLKQFGQQNSFQSFQSKGQIKSVKVINKASFDEIQGRQQVKEDAKLIKDLQILENKEKNLKYQIDKIQNQLERRKRDEEGQSIQVKCLYKNKLELMRIHEQQAQQNLIKDKNSKILHAQAWVIEDINLDQKGNHQKRQSFGGKFKDKNVIDTSQSDPISQPAQRQVSKTPVSNQANNLQNNFNQGDDSLGYQQLNRANYQKIGINNQAQKNQKQLKQQTTLDSANSSHQPSSNYNQNQIRHIVKKTEEILRNYSENEGRKVQKTIQNNDLKDQSPDISPGYYHIKKQTNSDAHVPKFNLIDTIESQKADKNLKKVQKNFTNNQEQSTSFMQIEGTDNEIRAQQIISIKKIYRPLTAIQKPIATIGNNFIKDLKEVQKDDSRQSISPDKELQIKEENSIISNSRVIDMSMVSKTGETKYSREELLKLKDKMKSMSPIKTQNLKSTLDPIQETLFPHYSITNKDNTKRVSFKDSSLSEIASQPAINNNFRYNKDVAQIHLENPNIVNRKSFEQTFNPKTEFQQSSNSQNQNTLNKHTRNQSVLQNYHDQVMTSKRSNQENSKNEDIKVDPKQIEMMKKKPQISNKYFNSVIENQIKAKQSILKNSTIDQTQAKEIISSNQQRVNNHTLNETLKVKINQEEEAHRDNFRDETIQTIRSRDNRSLDKSGIDFMTEARDFSNIIANLKTLLHKGKEVSQNQNSQKSFMTIDQRPSSKLSSINHSYMTNMHQGQQQNQQASINQQHAQLIERNYIMQQKRSISSQGTNNQIGLNTQLNQENNRRLTQLPNENLDQSKNNIGNPKENLSRLSNQQAYEDRRKKDFDLKLQRDVRALENILTQKHKQLKSQAENIHNQSVMSTIQQSTHQRGGSFNQSTLENNRHSITSSRSTSVQRPSINKMIGLMTFGQGGKDQQLLTPRGQSFSQHRKSIGQNGGFPPQENMGILLQSIKEVEEQLDILKGESSTIEQQISDLRNLRQPQL